MCRSAFVGLWVTVGVALASNACGERPSAEDLFGFPSDGGQKGSTEPLGGKDAGLSGEAGNGEGPRGEPSAGTFSVGGTQSAESGGSSVGGAGGALGEDEPGGSLGSGLTSGAGDGAVAGMAGRKGAGGSSGALGNGGSGGASGGSEQGGGSGEDGQAGAGGEGAGGGGGAGGGAGGSSGAGAGGTAGGPPTCASLQREAEALLAEAQACKPGRMACTGIVQDECECPVVVDNAESAASKKYVAAITEYRKRCAQLCLAVVCPTPRQSECVMSVTGGEGRCVAYGLGPSTPPSAF